MQQRVLRILSISAIALGVTLVTMLTIYWIFTTASDRYLTRQMLSREPLHTLQLQTYYDNRQFDRMWTYLQRYELSGDTYLIYEQAVDLYLELTSFRDACYALRNMEDPALLEQFLLNGQLEDILYQAYRIYRYPQDSPYRLLITPNDALHAEFTSEVTLTLQHTLQLTPDELFAIRTEEFWEGDAARVLAGQIEERLGSANE